MNRHNAPPVAYPLERSRFVGIFLLVLWLAGVLAALCWCYGIWRLDWRIGLAIATVLGAGFAAQFSWRQMPSGQIAWDGQSWRWKSANYKTGATEQEVSVIADFQHALLLRLENQAGASLWLWLERSAMPERWLDLRWAVYSPHRSSAAGQHDLPPEEAFVSIDSANSAGPAPRTVHAVKVPGAKA